MSRAFGWDLQPGCTNADIDRAFGDPRYRDCKNCGESIKDPVNDDQTECNECLSMSPCCGVKYDKDLSICPECKEHI